jgi:hypothetical protein
VNEKGEVWLIILLILFVALCLWGMATGPERCAVGFWEILSPWKNYCNVPF